jgi:hypothetical protein
MADRLLLEDGTSLLLLETNDATLVEGGLLTVEGAGGGVASGSEAPFSATFVVEGAGGGTGGGESESAVADPIFIFTPEGGADATSSPLSHAFAVLVPVSTATVGATFEDSDIIQGKWKAGDSLIINRILFSVAWDSITSQFFEHYVYDFVDSQDKYGRRAALIIRSKGIGGCGGGANLGSLDARAFAVGARFADPPAQLELVVLYRNHRLTPGDLVEITAPFIPNMVTGTRGLVNEVFEVVSVNYTYGNPGFVTLNLLDVAALTNPGSPSMGVGV